MLRIAHAGLRSRVARWALSPWVALPLYLFAFYGLYLADAADRILQAPGGHVGLEVGFLVAGMLFTIPILSSDPLPVRLGHAARALDVFAEAIARLREHGAPAVQILDPRIRTSHWDAVVAPQHDRLRGANVVELLGSLNPVQDGWLGASGIAFGVRGRRPCSRVRASVSAAHARRAGKEEESKETSDWPVPYCRRQ
jgi:hypothetical protein